MELTGASGVRILVTDDDPDTRGLLREYLEADGFTVIEAKNGAEAVDLVAADVTVGIVLLDMAMPECDGLSALRSIKRLNPDLPVIVMTGSAEPNEVSEAYTRGAIRVLRKPIAFGDLGVVIDRVTERKHT